MEIVFSLFSLRLCHTPTREWKIIKEFRVYYFPEQLTAIFSRFRRGKTECRASTSAAEWGQHGKKYTSWVREPAKLSRMKQIRDERERKRKKKYNFIRCLFWPKDEPRNCGLRICQKIFFIVLRAASNRGLKIAENRSVRVAGVSLVAAFARIFTEKSSTLKVSLEKGCERTTGDVGQPLFCFSALFPDNNLTTGWIFNLENCRKLCVFDTWTRRARAYPINPLKLKPLCSHLISQSSPFIAYTRSFRLHCVSVLQRSKIPGKRLTFPSILVRSFLLFAKKKTINCFKAHGRILSRWFSFSSKMELCYIQQSLSVYLPFSSVCAREDQVDYASIPLFLFPFN